MVDHNGFENILAEANGCDNFPNGLFTNATDDDNWLGYLLPLHNLLVQFFISI